MSNYPAFSSFRHLICLWESHENIKNKIKNIINGQNLILFFKKGSKLYGAPEESRIIFANMKNPDNTDLPTAWADEANFAAFDLIQALRGNSTENMFSIADMPTIDVIDRNEAEKLLMKCPSSSDSTANLTPKSSDDIGMIKLKDK